MRHTLQIRDYILAERRFERGKEGGGELLQSRKRDRKTCCATSLNLQGSRYLDVSSR